MSAELSRFRNRLQESFRATPMEQFLPPNPPEALNEYIRPLPPYGIVERTKEKDRSPKEKKVRHPIRTLIVMGTSISFGVTSMIALTTRYETRQGTTIDIAPFITKKGGVVEFDVPPGGAVKFKFFNLPIAPPIGLRMGLHRVSKNSLDYVKTPPPDKKQKSPANTTKELQDKARNDAKEMAIDWGLHAAPIVLVASGVPWLLAGLFTEEETRKFRRALKIISKGVGKGIATTVVTAGLLAELGQLTYDSSALNKPHYSGDLASALNIAHIKDLLGNLQSNRERFNQWMDGLAAIQKGLEIAPQNKNAINIIIYSHTEDTPCIYNLISSANTGFDADIDFDEGDIDSGILPQTGQIFSSQNTTPDCDKTIDDMNDIPIEVDPGNHDGEETLNNMKKNKNVTISDGHVRKRTFRKNDKDINLYTLGIPNPVHTTNPLTRGTPNATTCFTSEETQKMIQGGQDAAREVLHQGHVDIIKANERLQVTTALAALRAAGVSEDQLPLGIVGSREAYFDGDHTIGAGTIGGGLRSYEKGYPRDNSFVFLQFDPEAKTREEKWKIYIIRVKPNGISMDPVPVNNLPTKPSLPATPTCYPTTTTTLIVTPGRSPARIS